MSLKVNATTSQLGVYILALLEMVRQIVLAAVMLAMLLSHPAICMCVHYCNAVREYILLLLCQHG